MVGPWGLEPQTFPASRDALTGLGGADEFLYRSVRLPTLDLQFATTSRPQVSEFFPVNELPGSATSGIGAMVSLMFTKTTGQIRSRSDIECPCRGAQEDVDVGRHRNQW